MSNLGVGPWLIWCSSRWEASSAWCDEGGVISPTEEAGESSLLRSWGRTRGDEGSDWSSGWVMGDSFEYVCRWAADVSMARAVRLMLIECSSMMKLFSKVSPGGVEGGVRGSVRVGCGMVLR